MSDYAIHVCPVCREQATDPYEDGGHTHDGEYFTLFALEVVSGESWDWDAVTAERERQEREHAEKNAKRAAEKAEVERLEAKWLATAPPEQIAAWEKSQETSRRSGEAMRSIMAGSLLELQKDFNRSTVPWADFKHDPVAAAKAQQERAEETVRLFAEHGPTRVSFWRLREAHEVLKTRPQTR